MPKDLVLRFDDEGAAKMDKLVSDAGAASWEDLAVKSLVTIRVALDGYAEGRRMFALQDIVTVLKSKPNVTPTNS